MSSIDRAFIKAYSDEASQPGTYVPAANIADTLEGATIPTVNAAPTATAQVPRRAAARTKRTASAAAIRGAQQNPTASNQAVELNAPSIAENLPIPGTPGNVGAQAKMVVGRQALQQLAENATVPAPHAAFVQNRQRAAGQAESRIMPTASAAARSAPAASVASRQANDYAGAAPRATAPVVESRQEQIRVDSSLATTAEPPVAALEVDGLDWPPVCNTLIDCARADFESIAAQIADQAGNGAGAIAVLSIGEDQGGTTIAMCLARILGQKAIRSCLVDGDYRKPGLAESLGLDMDRGLESVLSGDAGLGEVLVESLEDQLLLLPLARPLAADAVERLKLRQTVTFGELRDQFDVVIVDAGSLGGAPARRPGMLGGGLIDSVILVGRQDAEPETWQGARQSLIDWNVPCLGAIANRCIA
jgi:Mrp family chromosome partitioning ATPase